MGNMIRTAIINHTASESMRTLMGLKKSALQRHADKALNEGISHSETVGSLNRYITALYKKKNRANNIRLYGEYTFLFRGDTLLTVHRTPQKYSNVVKAIKARKTVPSA